MGGSPILGQTAASRCADYGRSRRKLVVLVGKQFLNYDTGSMVKVRSQVGLDIEGHRLKLPDFKTAVDLPTGWQGPTDFPESGYRLRGAYDFLIKAAAKLDLELRKPKVSAGTPLLNRVHAASYLDRVRRIRSPVVSNETVLTSRTYAVASLAAESCAELAIRALHTKSDALALVRPPGHHARSGSPRGFCVFNNVAVATQALLDEGLQRVMVWDWDLHHGDGIQRIFARHDSVLYCSVHADSREIGYPPGDMDQSDKIGTGRRRGLNVNVPLPLGASDTEYLYAVLALILPIACAFRPEAVVVAAGFDSHAHGIEHPAYRAEQPGFSLSAGLFGELARFARQVVRPSAGPVVLVLEGGYSSQAVADCVKAVVSALKSGCAVRERLTHTTTSGIRASVLRRVEACRRNLAVHWHLPRGAGPHAGNPGDSQ